MTWLVNLASARALRGQWKRVAEARAEVRSVNVEALSHVRLLKSMGLERETFRRAVESTGAARVEAVSAARLNAGLGAINGVTQSLGTLLFTYVGWRMVITGSLTLGGFLAFTAYLGRLAGPIARMTSLFSEFQRTAITLDRVFELLDQQTESDPRLLYQSNDDPPPLPLAGDVRLDGVVMRYETGEFELRVPDLHFAEGSVTALVGESGAGKSTLLRLLAGIEQPDEGSVLYGGLAHHQLPLARVRKSVAVAWQQPELFRGTLRSNIAFGVADISAEELDELVDVCQLRDLVDGLPMGLESPVAEWGQTLSGGQQQRLSLARALARDAPLLLLDEITANLDNETEEARLPRLVSRVAGRTGVIASHRASVLPYADRVVRLRRGRIEEEWETLRPDFTPILGGRSVASS
ncbi:MAG: ATP-binding cassette domain-containing protein [Longimicrobiales bacterium]